MADDLQRLLEADLEGKRKRGELSPEDVLEMQLLWEKVRTIDLDKAVAERIGKLTPVEKMIEGLEKNRSVKDLRRAIKPKKLHYKTKKARIRKQKKVYYQEVAKPRRATRVAEQLKTPEGWWDHLHRTSWNKTGTLVELTFEEYLEHIYTPIIGKGRLPLFFRYDKNKPAGLGNILVRDSETYEVLFDGKEFTLRQLGYIL